MHSSTNRSCPARTRCYNRQRVSLFLPRHTRTGAPGFPSETAVRVALCQWTEANRGDARPRHVGGSTRPPEASERPFPTTIEQERVSTCRQGGLRPQTPTGPESSALEVPTDWPLRSVGRAEPSPVNKSLPPRCCFQILTVDLWTTCELVCKQHVHTLGGGRMDRDERCRTCVFGRTCLLESPDHLNVGRCSIMCRACVDGDRFLYSEASSAQICAWVEQMLRESDL